MFMMFKAETIPEISPPIILYDLVWNFSEHANW